jgi:hypothetical protein
MEPCFEEPKVPDPTPGREGESRGAWLRRSTWERAAETRRFYNANLRQLPSDIARRLCPALHADRTEATHFELIVGRFLQLLGAQRIAYEVAGTEGRKVDWLAHFEDGPISVECTAPIANGVIGDSRRSSRSATAIVLETAPPGWWVFIHRVPTLSPNKPRSWFRRLMQTLYADAPPARPDGEWSIQKTLDGGILEISLRGQPQPDAPAKWAAGPAVGYMDDTSDVVKSAVAGKRAQARGAVQPVLTAIYTAGFGSSELEKFDVALFGRTVSSLGSDALWLDNSGVFNRGEKTPTFAGALAFANLNMGGGPDPVLYVHPRYRGSIPSALRALRRREATDAGVRDVPTTRDAVLPRLGWPTAYRP